MTTQGIRLFAAAAAVSLATFAAPSLSLAQATPAATLRPQEIQQRPLTWPAQVTVNADLDDGTGNGIKSGTQLKFIGLDPQGVIVEVPRARELTIIPLDVTDFVERANAEAAKLPEDVRNLTFDDLVKRGDLLPEKVKLIEDVQFADKVRKAGSDVGPYRLIKTRDGVVIAALDPAMAKGGVYHQRQSYLLGATDFLEQLKAKVTSLPAASNRVADDLRGKLVNADGTPAADPAEPAKYYVVYSGASWCGWCTKFNPTLAKFYDDVAAKHPEVQVVYFGSDKSEQEMLAYLKKNEFKFPAVKYDQRIEAAFVLGQIDGSTPQVVVLDASGKVIHDGQPGGMDGAQAALRTLQRELAKK
jgi:thiol-disulfide isomerase/thioredoxin